MLPFYTNHYHSYSPSTRRRIRKKRRKMTQMCVTTFSTLALIASFWSLYRMKQVSKESIQTIRREQHREAQFYQNSTTAHSAQQNINHIINTNHQPQENIDMDGSSNTTNQQPNEVNLTHTSISIDQSQNRVSQTVSTDDSKQPDKNEKGTDQEESQWENDKATEEIERQAQTDLLDEEEGGRELHIPLPQKDKKKISLPNKSTQVKRKVYRNEEIKETTETKMENIQREKDLEADNKTIGTNREEYEEIDQAARKELDEKDKDNEDEQTEKQGNDLNRSSMLLVKGQKETKDDEIDGTAWKIQKDKEISAKQQTVTSTSKESDDLVHHPHW